MNNEKKLQEIVDHQKLIQGEIEQLRSDLEELKKAHKTNLLTAKQLPKNALTVKWQELYGYVYRSCGSMLRRFLPIEQVERLKTLVPHPRGIPQRLVGMPANSPKPTYIKAVVDERKELPDLFVFSIIDWDFRTQRPQHIARLLCENRRVFYIEMSLEPGGPKVRRLGKNLYCIRLNRDGLGHIQPYSDRVNGDQAQLWAESFSSFVDGISASSLKQVIIQHPFWWQMVRLLTPEFEVVFDCMDEISGFANTKDWILDLEHDLIEKADKIVVSSE